MPAANATELRRLFGSNVGTASHYKKNYVVDANGQVSVSYLDMAGRVIATALSEITPAGLLPIYSGSEGSVIVNLDQHHQIDYENRVSTLGLYLCFAFGKSYSSTLYFYV